MSAGLAGSSGNRAAQLQQYLREVEAALKAGDMPRALQISALAATQGFEHSHILVLAAYDQLNRNAPERALAYATRARELAPKNVDVLNVLGQALAKLNRPREALNVFNAALRQAPNTAIVHFYKGCALEELRELGHARNEFERVIALQANHAEALARLAHLAAQRGDMAPARDYATRALGFDPRQIVALLALAAADIEEKKFEAALSHLTLPLQETNPSLRNRSIAEGLRGDALDGLGKTTEAFAAYAASNNLLRTLYKPVYEAPGIESAALRLKRITDYFRNTSPEHWSGREGGAPIKPISTHVFLVGFPRSGTTLLEQVLASHPKIQALEERDCLIDAVNDFILAPDGLARLAAITDDQLAHYRQVYWKHVSAFGIDGKKPVFIDKMPLNTVLLCLIAKFFPQAKIVFALRDPRDVVLSCFRRRFGMTAQMYELLSLEGAATYYAGVMGLAELYRQKLGLDIFDLRYEDMVADFEPSLRKLCDFLDIEWNATMKDFAAHTREKNIDTPSAAQVARGLYNQGIGQWQRYREQLKPVQPILAPWVARFGYPGE
jgi:tetratricopeptide (TPR) repeat protein